MPEELERRIVERRPRFHDKIKYHDREMNIVESEYRRRTAELGAAERVRRCEAMFLWARDCLVRSLSASRSIRSEQELRLEIALRQYGSDPTFRELIDELRGRASR